MNKEEKDDNYWKGYIQKQKKQRIFVKCANIEKHTRI